MAIVDQPDAKHFNRWSFDDVEPVPNMVQWTSRHQDLLEVIFDLCLPPDQIRMQSVCKSWRLILKNCHELPWLMMLSKNNKKEEEHDLEHHQHWDACDFFSLSKQKIHSIHFPEIQGKRCCGSFENGWLMTIDDELNICLFHPWSKEILDLPHQSTFRHLNFIEYFIVSSESKEQIRNLQITKAALSANGKTVVIVYGFRSYRLAFSRIGDDAWTGMVIDCAPMDAIYHKGQFYFSSSSGGIYLLHIDNGNDYCKSLTEGLKDLYHHHIYLVPYKTDTNIMFVIGRRVVYTDFPDGVVRHYTNQFKIYKASLGEELGNRLMKVESLGDRIIFLGYNSLMIVMANEFLSLKGNCIYFTDISSDLQSEYGCADLGVYNIEDGTVELLFADRFHPPFAPPIWIATPPYSFWGD